MDSPKEKALSIIIKMQFSKPPLNFDKAKQCALICVDEVINIIPQFDEVDYHFNAKYWNEVKTAIIKQ